jgi:RNA polymerase sigma-70 factor (ECF subfamily)
MIISPDETRILVKGAVAGDRTALQQLLLLYYSFIESSVRAQFNDQLIGVAEPDDLIQEVLVKVHRNIRSYQERDEGTFEAWLRSIARNCMIDAVRRSGRLKRGGKAQRVRLRPVSPNDSLDTIWDWICQDAQPPDRSLRRAEARRALQVCLSQLPSAQREAVEAHYFHNLDTTEIAVKMNRTTGAVRELLRRAREKLGELMGTASTWLSR